MQPASAAAGARGRHSAAACPPPRQRSAPLRDRRQHQQARRRHPLLAVDDVERSAVCRLQHQTAHAVRRLRLVAEQADNVRPQVIPMVDILRIVTLELRHAIAQPICPQLAKGHVRGVEFHVRRTASICRRRGGNPHGGSLYPHGTTPALSGTDQNSAIHLCSSVGRISRRRNSESNPRLGLPLMSDYAAPIRHEGFPSRSLQHLLGPPNS